MFHINGHNFNASYGVVPKSVLAYQTSLSLECEANPYLWFTETYQQRLAATKKRLVPYLSADDSDFVFVDNSTSAANSVFNSLCFDEDSVIIVLQTVYGVIKNLVSKQGCRVVTIPVDVMHLDQLKHSVNEKIAEVHGNVALVCVDHIASAPGILLPVADISAVCKSYGVPVLVDGAHALGQVRVDLGELAASGVTYWFTDAHKWFFSPKGSALLWVHKHQQPRVRPAIDGAYISSRRWCERQTFAERFEYLGTKDYTPWLAVSSAIDFVEAIGGYSCLISRNHKLALWSRDFLSVRLNSTITVGDAVTASMCNVHLPGITDQKAADSLHRFLRERNMHVIVCEHPSAVFWLRLCAQIFVTKSSIQDLWVQLQAFFAKTRDTR
jgi:isopenicillin-N epimerase